MQRKINRKSSFVVHDIFRAVFVFRSLFGAAFILTLGSLINVLGGIDTYALPSISISNSSLVTITGDDVGGYVTPSSNGSLGVGVDHVNITTDCSAGYHFYVSGTSTSGTDLVREDADNPSDLANRIPSSSIAPSSPSPLAKNTWGVGKNGTDFTKIQEYNENIGLLTPLFSSTSGTNGSISSTFDVYFGVNISTDKEPGVYSGNVLYTAVLDDACLKYTLNFDTSSATSIDASAFEPRTIDYGANVDLSVFSDTTLISRIGYNLTGWKYTLGDQDYEFDIHFGANINPNDANKITLVPVWTPITYDLVYDAGETGGTCSELSVPVAYDSDITLSNAICTKLGYTQDGWSASQFEDNEKDYDLEQALEKPNFSDVDGNSYTLYPHFSINHPLLTINNGDTTAIASVSPETGEVEYNTEVTATCIANTGYHCTGWTSTDENVIPSTVAVNYTFNMPDNPVTLTANASPNTYTIRYNGNGGTGETESQTGEAYGSTTTLRESGFLRSGHHFVGWAYSDTAEEPDFTGGQTGVSISALAENNASGSVVNTNGGTIDLYAVWSGNNYTFVFDTNGGTGSPASASSSAPYDGTIVPPGVGTMEKTNYEFIGWSLSSTSGTEDYTANTAYNASTIVNAAGKATENNAEIVLYATWSGLPFTLRTVNGNTTAVSSVSPDTSGTTKRYGSSVTVSCYANTGYHCTGWTSSDTSLLPSSSNASYTFSMPGDITLTADGAVNTYTIRYNANGGSGSTASQTGQTYGSTTTLQSNGFSRDGYSFQGWAYSSSASSADFSAGQSNVSVSTLASNAGVVDTNGGVIDLYAVWRGNSYTIAYSAGSTGGSCSVSSTSATYGSSVQLSSNTCSKTGYHQDGWSTSSSSSNTRDYSLGGYASNLTTSGTTYLYPHFVANTYTIKYTSYGAPHYSHTPNISDTGSQSGSYSNNMDTNEVITVPGASKLRITLTYQTESTSYDWVSFWEGSYPSYTASNNYSSGVKLGGNTDGKYGGTTKTTVEGVISGNTVTFGFRSDTSVTNYGYYAVITPLDSSGNPLSNVTGSTSSQTATYGNNVTLNSNGFSRSGYSFNGWSFSQNTSSPSYYAGSSYAVSSLASSAGVTNTDGGVITLYAAWQQQTTYRTLTVNAGSCISSVSGSGSKVVGNTAYISASASTGCHFDYWNVNSGGASLSSYYSASTSFTMPDNNVTVTAYGAYNTYTIAYDANGGSGTTSPQTGQSYNSSVTLRSNNFSRSGYRFTGWSISSNTYSEDTSYAVSTLASAAGVTNSNGATITLYAMWEEVPVGTVAFQTTGSCAHITPGTTGALYDSRDNQSYYVYRWPTTGTSGTDYPKDRNGFCIMTQDLALGSVTSGSITKNSNLVLTTTDSYSSGTVVARTQNGTWDTSDTGSNLQYVNADGSTYYSYYAAQKVCPRGWKPMSSTELTNLISMAGGGLMRAPYNFSLNGLYDNTNHLFNKNVTGNYWSSSTTSSTGYSTSLYLYTNNVPSSNTLPRNNGMTVRCVNSRAPYMHDVNLSVINPGTTTALKDFRDSQWYNVYRFPTSSYPTGWSNKVIMTEDLRLGYVSSTEITAGSNLSLTTDTSAAKATITARTGSSWSTTDSDSNKQYRNITEGDIRHPYYSYGAAQAVCPANWSLPTDTQYSNLATFMGGETSAAVTKILSSPYNFALDGYAAGGDNALENGTLGSYWASTEYSSISGYRLFINQSGVRVTYGNKYFGRPVRCIATAQ